MPNGLPSLIIADSSCLIGLANINLFDILHKLYETVTITPEIAAEYGLDLPDWIIVTPVKNTILQMTIQSDLHAGEASAIALALENPGSLVVLDDKKARRYAANLGLVITGTMGIVISAAENGIIKDAVEVFENLRKIGFRLPNLSE
jgi:predicted nucleic acid-binding protein